jgi:hypothetical protein
MDHTNTVWVVSNDGIPLGLKVSVTLFVCLLVPVYWLQYGPGNFLWFSDLALLLTVPALWLESALLASMMALAVGLLEMVWIIDFIIRLITGVSVTGLSRYMFNQRISMFIRALSLFHIALPVLLLWMVYRLGYDGRALGLQTLLAWIVLPMSYLLTKRSENVNWVYGFGNQPQRFMPARLYVGLLMALLPLAVYLPTHVLLGELFG